MGFGKDGKGFILQETLEIAPGALAANDVSVHGNYTANLREDFRIVKTEYLMNWRAGGSNEFVVVGMCDGGLTAAEVEECLENECFDSNDAPASETTMRPVWSLEILASSDTGGKQVAKGEKTLRWTFKDTQAWNWFVYNPDNVAITTGGDIVIVAKHFGVWVN